MVSGSALLAMFILYNSKPNLLENQNNIRVGSDFFVVGDFGWVRDMTDPNSVFDAID